MTKKYTPISFIPELSIEKNLLVQLLLLNLMKVAQTPSKMITNWRLILLQHLLQRLLKYNQGNQDLQALNPKSPVLQDLNPVDQDLQDHQVHSKESQDLQDLSPVDPDLQDLSPVDPDLQALSPVHQHLLLLLLSQLNQTQRSPLKLYQPSQLLPQQPLN
jgi:hypothetical protein